MNPLEGEAIEEIYRPHQTGMGTQSPERYPRRSNRSHRCSKADRRC